MTATVNGFHFRFGQDDLPSVCAERPLRTSEKHCVNDVYGQASILKRYCYLPQGLSLRAIIEHGVFISGKMMDYDRSACLPVALSPSPERAAFIERECGKRAVPIGFSYLYAMRLCQRQFGLNIDDARRRGCVVFPVHSTPKSVTQFDQAEYARRLVALPKRFQPVIVCVYWKDYHLGHHKPYEDQGLQVVSAGHMYDRDFLLRFYDICRQCRYAAANFIGSNLFLSVATGCRYFYFESPTIDHATHEDEKADASLDDPTFQRVQAESRRLFNAPVEEITPAQLEFVDAHLGTRFVRSPTTLARVIAEAQLRDVAWPMANSRIVPPPFWRRKARQVARLTKYLEPRRAPSAATVQEIQR